MQNSKIDRLKELNKLWFRLHTPKIGDIVKFKVRGEKKIHEGEITNVTISGNNYKFQMVSKTAKPVTGLHNIIIVEANGVKFQEIDDPTDHNNFKPI